MNKRIDTFFLHAYAICLALCIVGCIVYLIIGAFPSALLCVAGMGIALIDIVHFT